MHAYEQQYFDTLVGIATDRFVERAIYHSEGAQKALELLKENPYGKNLWLDRFVQSFFEEFLLDNVSGYCLVLQALANNTFHKEILTNSSSITISELLEKLSKKTFESLLIQKSEEVLEQSILFGG